MDVFSTTLLVNLSTLFFAFVAGGYVWNQRHPGKIYFVAGLCLVVFSGVFAVPIAEYYVDSTTSAITLSNIVGVVHGAGLVLCALAFTRSRQHV